MVTDYSQMEPGPDLDALVAVKVMGWELENSDQYAQQFWKWKKRPEGWIMWWARYKESWSPSTSVTDAMEVLGRMLALNSEYSWAIYFWPDGSNRMERYCTEYIGGMEADCGEYMSDNAPLPVLICRAALAAAEKGAGHG